MFISEVIGNIGSDAVVRDISGKKFVSFNVAHTVKGRDQYGNSTESTVWISCLWYGDGGGLLQYLKRGAKVFVRGRTSIKLFTRRDGSVDAGVNIDATEIQLCDKKREEDLPE